MEYDLANTFITTGVVIKFCCKVDHVSYPTASCLFPPQSPDSQVHHGSTKSPLYLRFVSPGTVFQHPGDPKPPSPTCSACPLPQEMVVIANDEFKFKMFDFTSQGIAPSSDVANCFTTLLAPTYGGPPTRCALPIISRQT